MFMKVRILCLLLMMKWILWNLSKLNFMKEKEASNFFLNKKYLRTLGVLGSVHLKFFKMHFDCNDLDMHYAFWFSW